MPQSRDEEKVAGSVIHPAAPCKAGIQYSLYSVCWSALVSRLEGLQLSFYQLIIEHIG
jgi:hypothetical protein